MKVPRLSADSEALLLLTCPAVEDPAGTAKADHLRPTEWTRFRAALDDVRIRPADLLKTDRDQFIHIPPPKKRSSEWLDERMRLAARLAFFRGRLEDEGIWITTTYEPTYPSALRQRLGDRAPPYLFGLGDPSLAHGPGIGLVGSRNPNEHVAESTRALARSTCQAGLCVVSGGARGVDELSQEAAENAGGRAVVFPAEGLSRFAADAPSREPIVDGRLLMLTPYLPQAGWSVGAAMGRNRLIYAAARATVVMATAEGKGGTWAGATEALKHDYGPVFVWTGTGAPAANVALVAEGAVPIHSLEPFENMVLGARHDTTQPLSNASRLRRRQGSRQARLDELP